MATQTFEKIAETTIASRIGIMLNGNTEGIMRGVDIRNNVEGDSVAVYSKYGASNARRKVGTKTATPESQVPCQERIIKPIPIHDAISVTWEDRYKLTHDPLLPLGDVLGNSLKSAIDSEIVRSAFGDNITGPSTSTGTAEFDKSMVVPYDLKLHGSSAVNNSADKFIAAKIKLAKIKKGSILRILIYIWQ